MKQVSLKFEHYWASVKKVKFHRDSYLARSRFWTSNAIQSIFRQFNTRLYKFVLYRVGT